MRKLALDSSAKWQENKTRGQVGGKERKLDLKIADLFSPIYIYCFFFKLRKNLLALNLDYKLTSMASILIS